MITVEEKEEFNNNILDRSEMNLAPISIFTTYDSDGNKGQELLKYFLNSEHGKSYEDNPNIVDNTGATPVHHLVAYPEYLKIYRKHCEKNNKKIDFNAKDKGGSTAIINALLTQRLDTVKYLHETCKVSLTDQPDNLLKLAIAQHFPDRNRNMKEVFKYLIENLPQDEFSNGFIEENRIDIKDEFLDYMKKNKSSLRYNRKFIIDSINSYNSFRIYQYEKDLIKALAAGIISKIAGQTTPFSMEESLPEHIISSVFRASEGIILKSRDINNETKAVNIGKIIGKTIRKYLFEVKDNKELPLNEIIKICYEDHIPKKGLPYNMSVPFLKDFHPQKTPRINESLGKKIDI